MATCILDSSKCKGIVQQGPRKGLQCQREISDSGYCVHHQRNYEYEKLTLLGKKMCNGFFRGCNNELTKDDQNHHRKFCSECRTKKSGKQFTCKYKDCKFKIKNEEDKYCDKHIRELFRDNEKEKNIQYCDISRGCFNILTGDIKCSECRIKEKQKATNEMKALRLKYNIILPERNTKDELFEKQESIVSEIKSVWRNVQRNAIHSKRLFTLTQEDFEKLVISPCYYCGFYSDCKFIGIDRIDNNKGYILNNCVSACKMCNMMKSTQHPVEFLDKIELICAYKKEKKSIINKSEVKWPTYFTKSNNVLYKTYIYDVGRRAKSIKFLISETEYNTLVQGECYLCGINPMEGHRNGIDRVDSDGDYTIDNCKTCCGHCNKMKRDYSYEDFIRKCIQIKTNNCDRKIFQGISYIDPNEYKLTKEYYTSDEIANMLKEGHLTRFLEWCEEKEKSAEFMSEITFIASKLESNIIENIKRELDNERARKLNQFNNPDKKHLHCGTLYSWLLTGKETEFLNWYGSQYEKTTLFDERFKILKEILPTLNKEEGIKACKKFMYDEKSRRNSQKNRNKKCKDFVEYSSNIKNEIHTLPCQVLKSSEIIKISANVSDTDTNKIIQRLTNDKNKISAPKQWKALDIYNYIKEGNQHAYYEYIKEHNNIALFQEKWDSLLVNVKSKSFEESESIIREFIHYLRNIRHNELCTLTNSKKVLEKEDRQHYRTDGVLIIMKSKNKNDIENFKSYTENYAGDSPNDPKWINRWNAFLTSVENETTDENKKKNISNFLMAQRKKKNDRAKRITIHLEDSN